VAGLTDFDDSGADAGLAMVFGFNLVLVPTANPASNGAQAVLYVQGVAVRRPCEVVAVVRRLLLRSVLNKE
jgi:hypothetical protein